jgi:hypothetical protein
MTDAASGAGGIDEKGKPMPDSKAELDRPPLDWPSVRAVWARASRYAEGPFGFAQVVFQAAALWKKVISEPSLSDDALFAGLTDESPCVVAYCASALSRRRSPLLRQLPAGLLARSETVVVAWSGSCSAEPKRLGELVTEILQGKRF